MIDIPTKEQIKKVLCDWIDRSERIEFSAINEMVDVPDRYGCHQEFSGWSSITLRGFRTIEKNDEGLCGEPK